MLLTQVNAQFNKVHTFNTTSHSVQQGSDQNASTAIYQLNSSTGKLDLHNGSFQKQASISLYLPSGYSVDTLLKIDELLERGTSGTKYAYKVSNTTGNTMVIVCDASGSLIKSFSDAHHIELIQPGKRVILLVQGSRNGEFYSELHSTANASFPVLKSFPTEHLSFGLLNTDNPDSTDFYYYFIDTENDKLLGYTYDFQPAFSPTLSIPVESTLEPLVYPLMNRGYNTTTQKEFAVVYDAGTSKSAAVFDETGKLLQTFPGAEELIVHVTSSNLFAKVNQLGSYRWDAYSFVEGKNFDNAEFQLSLPNIPRTNALNNACYQDDDSTLMKFTSVGKSIYSLANEDIDLELRSNEELVTWQVLNEGHGDGDDTNIEIYYVAKDATANSYRFSIIRKDGTTLLDENGISDFEFWNGLFYENATRLLLHGADGSTKVFDHEWGVTSAKRKTPAHKENPVTNLDVLFNWNKVPFATTYNVLVTSDSTKLSGDDIIFQGTTSDTFVVAPALEPSTTYYWLIRVKNANNVGFNRRFFSFTTLDLADIERPTLLGPMNGTADLSKEHVSLFWNASKNASSFEYQISETVDFNAFVSGTSLDSTASPGGFEYATTYYWRVRSINGSYNSKWSDVWSFKTGEKLEIISPTLQSPANFLINTSTSLDLVWNSVDDAISYTLEYADNPSFIAATSVKTTTTSHTLANLNYLTQYFWRVKVTTSEGDSYWSAIWNFVTIQAPKLGISVLTAPANNSKDVNPKEVTLKWVSVTGADGYRYQVSTDPNFGSFISGDVTEESATLPELDENTLYFWRVRTKKANAHGDWSEIWIFETGLFESINELSTQNIKVYPNPASTYIMLQSSSTETLSYSIYSTEGKLIETGNIPPLTQKRLNTSAHPSGVYHLRTVSKNGVRVQEITIW